MSFTPAPGHHGPWVQQQQKTRVRLRATTSPPPVFEIPTRNRFAPLRETERDAVIVGDSIVRHVRATVSWRATTALQLLWFTQGLTTPRCGRLETLKRDFRSLIETVRSTSPATTIIVSGPLPTYRRGHERFSRLFALNKWLLSWCKEQKLLFVNNWNLFWERPRLFRADGLQPSRVGAELLSDNISKTLRSVWLVSQFSNNCYDDFCSTHLNDRSTCIVQSINLYRLCLFPELWGQKINLMQDLEKIWSWLNQKNAK